MCLNVSGYYCQVFWEKKKKKDAFEMMGWESNSKNMGVDVIEGKGQKVPCFPLQPYISWRLCFGFKIKKTKVTGWCKNVCSTTELQAALVCTITKRCSLGGENNKTTLRLTSQLWNDSEKSTKPTNVSLQGTITQLWLDRFSQKLRLWWRKGRKRRRRDVNKPKNNRDYQQV